MHFVVTATAITLGTMVIYSVYQVELHAHAAWSLKMNGIHGLDISTWTCAGVMMLH